MTLQEDGFDGITAEFRSLLSLAFAENGGIRAINAENIARELDDDLAYHLAAEERLIQILLFYHCLAETSGFLPESCFAHVEGYIIEYKAIRAFRILSPDEQKQMEAIISDLLSRIHAG